MKEKIREIAIQNNIYHYGVAPMRKYDELLPVIEGRNQCDFESKNIEERINPYRIMKNGKSVLAFLFPYYNGAVESSLARYASIPDYHVAVRNQCEKITNEVSKLQNDFEYKILVDNHPLPERHIAYLAGLGFFGKNHCLINEKLGSFFFIGLILTNLQLEPDFPAVGSCKGCNKCIESCPGKALDGNFNFGFESCLSYITQKKELSGEQIKLLSKSKLIIGCDICQNVCPHNLNLEMTPIEAFRSCAISGVDDPSFLSNKEFMKKYGKYAFSWCGKRVIARNINISRNDPDKAEHNKIESFNDSL